MTQIRTHNLDVCGAPALPFSFRSANPQIQVMSVLEPPLIVLDTVHYHLH